MSPIARSLGYCGLITLLAAPVFADELVSSFEEAAARGDAQEKTAATKEDFAKTLMPYFGQTYAPILQSCFGSVANPGNSAFSFVVAIGADRRTARVYADRDTNMFRFMNRRAARLGVQF